MYKVTLQNGHIIDDLELNGNNYIANTVIEENIFKDNLKTVTVSRGNDTVTHNDMKLVQLLTTKENQTWFILSIKTKEESENEEFRKTIADLTEIVLLGGL